MLSKPGKNKYLSFMGGKSYYCDYCKCFMKNDINVRKSHNAGMAHNIAKANYLAQFKDPQQILEEESRKIPCKRFINNEECSFGAFCHFSHYFPEQLANLQSTVTNIGNQEKANEIQRFPWKYPKKRKYSQATTPSLQPIDFNKITKSCFKDQWANN